MSSVKNSLSNSNNEELTQIGLSTVNSEDIQILDSKIAKYLEFQNKIREIISTNTTSRDALVNDGLHPYDWTERVRRVWRDSSFLFSFIASNASNSSGGR